MPPWESWTPSKVTLSRSLWALLVSGHRQPVDEPLASAPQVQPCPYYPYQSPSGGTFQSPSCFLHPSLWPGGPSRPKRLLLPYSSCALPPAWRDLSPDPDLPCSTTPETRSCGAYFALTVANAEAAPSACFSHDLMHPCVSFQLSYAPGHLTNPTPAERAVHSTALADTVPPPYPIWSWLLSRSRPLARQGAHRSPWSWQGVSGIQRWAAEEDSHIARWHSSSPSRWLHWPRSKCSFVIKSAITTTTLSEKAEIEHFRQ